MLWSMARLVKFALVMNAFLPSTTMRFACMRECGGPGTDLSVAGPVHGERPPIAAGLGELAVGHGHVADRGAQLLQHGLGNVYSGDLQVVADWRRAERDRRRRCAAVRGHRHGSGPQAAERSHREVRAVAFVLDRGTVRRDLLGHRCVVPAEFWCDERRDIGRRIGAGVARE